MPSLSETLRWLPSFTEFTRLNPPKFELTDSDKQKLLDAGFRTWNFPLSWAPKPEDSGRRFAIDLALPSNPLLPTTSPELDTACGVLSEPEQTILCAVGAAKTTLLLQIASKFPSIYIEF